MNNSMPANWDSLEGMDRFLTFLRSKVIVPFLFPLPVFLSLLFLDSFTDYQFY